MQRSPRAGPVLLLLWGLTGVLGAGGALAGGYWHVRLGRELLATGVPPAGLLGWLVTLAACQVTTAVALIAGWRRYGRTETPVPVIWQLSVSALFLVGSLATWFTPVLGAPVLLLAALSSLPPLFLELD